MCKPILYAVWAADEWRSSAHCPHWSAQLSSAMQRPLSEAHGDRYPGFATHVLQGVHTAGYELWGRMGFATQPGPRPHEWWAQRCSSVEGVVAEV